MMRSAACLAILLCGLGADAVHAQAPPGDAAPAPAAPDVPADAPRSRDWKQLRTASLTVIGNAGASELRRVATEIERFRAALGAFAPSMQLDSPLPTTASARPA
jgi:hypothetical protein